MYTKDQLIHEGVRVLKVSYYFLILLSIKIAIDLVLVFVPETTHTIRYDAQGNGTDGTISKRYKIGFMKDSV